MADGVSNETSVADRVKKWLAEQGQVKAFRPFLDQHSHIEDALMYGVGANMKQSESRLHRPGGDLRVQHISLDEFTHIDPAAYKQIRDAINGGAVQQRPVVRTKTLQEYTDADLVMEMIRRGYAAMKLPGDGGPPEMLR